MRKVLMVISIIAVITLAVLNMAYSFGPEPDAVYPMANRNITWKYAGK